MKEKEGNQKGKRKSEKLFDCIRHNETDEQRKDRIKLYEEESERKKKK